MYATDQCDKIYLSVILFCIFIQIYSLYFILKVEDQHLELLILKFSVFVDVLRV